MALIHEPQCPMCGSTLPLRVLWKFARRVQSMVPAFGFLNSQSGLLRGNIGIACPGCLARFKVVQTRIRVVRFLSWSLLLVCVALFGLWARRAHLAMDKWLVYAVLSTFLISFAWLQSFLTPFLAQVCVAPDDEHLSYPLKSAYDEPEKSPPESRGDSGI